MKSITVFLAITASGFISSGCSDSPVIQEYKAMTAEMCACADAACADAADKKEQKWREGHYKSMSKDERSAMGVARQEFTKCRDALKK